MHTNREQARATPARAETAGLSGPRVIVNTRTGESGTARDFVDAFDTHWRQGRMRLESLLDLLAPQIQLRAPGVRTTQGKEAARSGFERMFQLLPDLHAMVDGWAVQDELLFIEMTFHASVGGSLLRFANVDRFRFEQGLAVERVAYFDPGIVRRAFLATPRGWLQLLRGRAGL